MIRLISIFILSCQLKFLLFLKFLGSKVFAFFVEDFEFSPSIYHLFNELSQLQDKDD